MTRSLRNWLVLASIVAVFEQACDRFRDHPAFSNLGKVLSYDDLDRLTARFASYLINESIARSKFANAREMDFEKPLTMLVWLTSLISILMTFIASYLLIPDLAGNTTLTFWTNPTVLQ